jgi:hypothetical protein
MRYRTPTYYTDAQRALMWGRWKEGWTLHQIAHLLNRADMSVEEFLLRPEAFDHRDGSGPAMSELHEPSARGRVQSTGAVAPCREEWCKSRNVRAQRFTTCWRRPWAHEAHRIATMSNQLDVRVLDLGDQPVDSEHELLSVPIRTICQQRASVRHKLAIAPSAGPALYLAVTHMRQAADVIGTPRMPECGEHVFERKLGGEVVFHAAVQHSGACTRLENWLCLNRVDAGDFDLQTASSLGLVVSPSRWRGPTI